LLVQSRRTAARSVNGILTSTYWEIGRQIVEYEQGGKLHALYGGELLKRLGADLAARYGRGFAWRNLYSMRNFYLDWEILQTPSAKLEARARCPAIASEKLQTLSAKLQPRAPLKVTAAMAGSLPEAFPLPWSHYVRLMAVKDGFARSFYEEEAIRGAWSVRQLDRQISTLFYERTALSRRKEAMLLKGQVPRPEDAVSLEETIRDPYLLEFLGLKDEYSESELEEAIIRHLETFLLELGAGFSFVARQKRIRIGDEWYRIDLLLFHRRLRCLVIIDLKIGKFTHADAGQMNLYINYAREHLVMPGEEEPVGIILCSHKDDAVVHYATGGIQAKVFASKYLVELPDEETLRQEIRNTQQALLTRAAAKGGRT
jgi:predicted nuclease of restriction endonuclease-like (RecB) superfamily